MSPSPSKDAASEVLRRKRAHLQALLGQARELSLELSPLSKDAAKAAPTWRAAYSDRTCALMSAFCAVAYDRFEDAAGHQRDLMRAKLEAAGFKLVGTYSASGGTQAYLAVSEQFAVLAFRGTESADDWGVNLNAKAEVMRVGPTQVRVHGGFLAAFRSVEEEIKAHLARYVPSDLGLYITGHSLGGALAQIASAAFARDNLAACYTFGAPRVGTVSFDRVVKCPHYRLVNDWDIVPGLPPPLWRGYLHSGDVRTLTKAGDAPLRRNRFVVGVLVQTVVALFGFVFNRKLFLIDDHMIWAYKEKLDRLA